MADPFDLQRFVDAQDRGGDFETAVMELSAGRKRSHWIWFVFPQLSGLGRSAMAVRYGIKSRDEVTAYLAHDVLGPRLRWCAQLVAHSGAVTAEALMGSVDALKLKSSMTLFAEVTDGDRRDFTAVLDEYYGGQRDEQTLRMLASR
ncbi:DUF1810 domain-containing protein [Mycolicibacterium hodleri]|uniref:DUF1810 domain-containing protein n=1 Tax=Mycolicibacterium hodleri TaxID=49897 RepID=A0A502EB71_9MYCO|nr:DUF1810 domain-containing protein [Mycolicibacterium hodleri]TPG33681.1 DUF1810 domain-containing protein [Mycolicibacterium hodleri]